MSTKVTFLLPAEVVADATSGIILGEFNNWDSSLATSLKKQKDGSMKATIILEPGKTYQYRYLLNDGRWVNDHTADDFVHVSGYHVENCVITVPAAADDLTKIEGIGKRIAEVLASAGISTFEELSKSTEKNLKSILDDAGSKFKSFTPVSWPKQAKLAATGKWPELRKLQKELKATK